MFNINVRQANLSGEAKTEAEARSMLRDFVNRAVKASPNFPKAMVERIYFDDWLAAYNALAGMCGIEPKNVEIGTFESYSEFFMVRYFMSSVNVNDLSVVTRLFQMNDMRKGLCYTAVVTNGQVVSMLKSDARASGATVQIDTETGETLATFEITNYRPGVGMTSVKRDAKTGVVLDELHRVLSPSLIPAEVKEKLAAFPFLGKGTAWSDMTGEFCFTEEISEDLVTDEIKLEVAGIIDAVAPMLRERIRLASIVHQQLENGVSVMVDTSDWLN